MGNTCKMVTGVLLAVAGLLLVLFGLGNVGTFVAHVVGGTALLLVGLSKLVHCMNMCPSCKCDDKNCKE